MTDTAPVKFLLITDTHCYANDEHRLEWSHAPIYPNRSLTHTLQHIKAHSQDKQALIITGDLAQEEVPQTYQNIAQQLADFPLPSYVIAGNHDTPSMLQATLGEHAHIKLHQQFNRWHFIFLDTHKEQRPEGEITPEQFKQLNDCLSHVPIDHFVVIFMHHHPMDIHSAWMDRIGLEQREQFWAMVSEYPQIRAVFHGHIHQNFSGAYRYMDGREVPVYGTASTCIQFKPRHAHIEFDHINPVWRETTLYPSGRIETKTHQVDLGITLSKEMMQLTPSPLL